VTDRSETLARIERENELAVRAMSGALDAVDESLHSVRADLHPVPTPEEDAARLDAWLEDLHELYKEHAQHRNQRGIAKAIGLAALGRYHEKSAVLAKQVSEHEDRCAEILRRQAWRHGETTSEEE
jgi:hypothetical protein